MVKSLKYSSFPPDFEESTKPKAVIEIWLQKPRPVAYCFHGIAPGFGLLVFFNSTTEMCTNRGKNGLEMDWSGLGTKEDGKNPHMHQHTHTHTHTPPDSDRMLFSKIRAYAETFWVHLNDCPVIQDGCRIISICPSLMCIFSGCLLWKLLFN